MDRKISVDPELPNIPWRSNGNDIKNEDQISVNFQRPFTLYLSDEQISVDPASVSVSRLQRLKNFIKYSCYDKYKLTDV